MNNLTNIISGLTYCTSSIINKNIEQDIIINNLISYGKIKYDNTEYLNGNITRKHQF